MVQGLGFRVNSKAPTIRLQGFPQKKKHPTPWFEPIEPSKGIPIAPLKEPL